MKPFPSRVRPRFLRHCLVRVYSPHLLHVSSSSISTPFSQHYPHRHSSWKSRQKSDPYVQKRHKLQLRSRAYFKLQQMFLEVPQLKRHPVAKSGARRVVDLGCAPGSWIEWILKDHWKRNGVRDGICIGIDLLPVEGFDGFEGYELDGKFEGESRGESDGESGVQKSGGVDSSSRLSTNITTTYRNQSNNNTLHILRGDFTNVNMKKQMHALLRKQQRQGQGQQDDTSSASSPSTHHHNHIDMVLSDMAPEVTGIRFADHDSILNLVSQAYEFACENLAPNGIFICKLFAGGDEGAFRTRVKGSFRQVTLFKPDSSRSGSREIFLVASGFKGEKAKNASAAVGESSKVHSSNSDLSKKDSHDESSDSNLFDDYDLR